VGWSQGKLQKSREQGRNGEGRKKIEGQGQVKLKKRRERRGGRKRVVWKERWGERARRRKRRGK